MACNDGHAEPQDAALKTLRLFCRNPRCRQVLVSLGIQQRLVRFLERSRMSGACSQQSSISSVPSTARTNDSVVSEHCVRILNKLIKFKTAKNSVQINVYSAVLQFVLPRFISSKKVRSYLTLDEKTKAS